MQLPQENCDTTTRQNPTRALLTHPAPAASQNAKQHLRGRLPDCHVLAGPTDSVTPAPRLLAAEPCGSQAHRVLFGLDAIRGIARDGEDGLAREPFTCPTESLIPIKRSVHQYFTE